MWTPALQRDRRIALQDRSTRFFGTDFSFEDLEEREVEQSDYSMLGSDTIDGAACWEIEMTPRRGRASQYTRSIAWIRKDNYVLVRLDNFVDNQVVKRLTNSTIENRPGHLDRPTPGDDRLASQHSYATVAAGGQVQRLGKRA